MSWLLKVGNAKDTFIGTAPSDSDDEDSVHYLYYRFVKTKTKTCYAANC